MSRSKVTWTKCEKCFTIISDKSTEVHTTDCPPKICDMKYGFIKEGTLYGQIDIKTNVENVSDKVDIESLVFLSESVIQLCSLAIGNWALIKPLNTDESPVAKIVWPTLDKTLTSILLTKEGVQTCFKHQSPVSVTNFNHDVKPAKNIVLIILNAPKHFEATNELQSRLRHKQMGKIIVTGNKLVILFYGKLLKLEVKSIQPSSDLEVENTFAKLDLSECFYITNSDTQWTIFRNKEEYLEVQEASTHFLSKIGGLDDEILQLQDYLRNCFHPSTNSLIVGSSHSVLLFGSSGTGKTLLAEAVAQDSQAHIVTISPASLYSSSNGGAESYINSSFEEAVERQPSIIIIDNIDILCPSWSGRLTDSDKRVSATLFKKLDNLSKNTKARIFVLATSNKPDAIDSAFRRCGILDCEVEIPVPTPKARKEILLKLLENTKYDLNGESLTDIALNSHGFVGADLVSLCSKAALHASKQCKEAISLEDFKYAQRLVKPSAMREVQIEVPNVKWSDIGGQEDLKLILKQAVEWPLKYPQSFIRLGVSPPRGVLMYGPPGCSKTMIAKALATESGLNFLSIKGPELFSKWVGESERAVREVFRKARQVSPSIIFFDEIDALGGERTSGSSSGNVQERVLAQLLTELDGVTPLGDVTIVAATNRPDKIDKALLRPGRLDRIVYVPLPNLDTRKDIFRIKLAKMPVSNVNIDDLVNLTKTYSGAEINAVCHEAAMAALEENLEAAFIEYRHFEKALTLVTPRTPPSLLKLYEDYQKIKL